MRIDVYAPLLRDHALPSDLIFEIAPIQEVLEVNTTTLQKLLTALNECTEWGQVFILDALARYTPTDTCETENIIERVVPHLKYVNSTVILSAFCSVYSQVRVRVRVRVSVRVRARARVSVKVKVRVWVWASVSVSVRVRVSVRV